MSKPLDELEPGMGGRVVGVASGNGAQRRLAELGITRGTHVRLERVAPLGDPLEINVRGYRLSLRRDEANGISIDEE